MVRKRTARIGLKHRRHLSDTTKRKISKSMKAYWRKKKFRYLPKNIKYMIHFKAIYDSERGSSHDFFTEGKLIIITNKSMTESQMKNIIYERITNGQFETNTGFYDFFMGMDYNEMEIGIDRCLTNEDEDISMEIDRYGYNIEA